MEPYTGEIKLLPYTRIPQGWLPCNGQTLAISQNTALFSLLGTTYGGNGTTTFCLPDLRGRVPVNLAQLGSIYGTPGTTLIPANIPSHTHLINCSDQNPDEPAVLNGIIGKTSGEKDFISKTDPTTKVDNALVPMAGIAAGGSNAPVSNMQPYLGLSMCICVSGIYPSRS